MSQSWMVIKARKIALYANRVWGNEKLAMIAERFNCKAHSSVSKTVSEIEAQIQNNKALRKVLDSIYERLKIN